MELLAYASDSRARCRFKRYTDEFTGVVTGGLEKKLSKQEKIVVG